MKFHKQFAQLIFHNQKELLNPAKGKRTYPVVIINQSSAVCHIVIILV